MSSKILFRRDTAANWTSANPVLDQGEMGLEYDTNKFKVGNGVTAWTSLAYASGEQGVSITSVARTSGNGSPGTTDTYTISFSNSTSTTFNVVNGADGADGTDGEVTLSTAQTLSNKTLNSVVLNGGYSEQIFALGTSGSLALNPANGSIQTCALSGAPTFTDSVTAGRSIVLMLTNGASHTVTWPTVTWVTAKGNVAPTLTAANTLVFWKVSTTLYGAVVGSYV
jgi:hypothetical protein